eukprot:gene12177-13434_t
MPNMNELNEFHVYLGGGSPWGFRLQGGKEFRTPLRVAKVTDDGKAYHAGVKVGDQVLEINGKHCDNLYHTEALVAVKKATQTLDLKLRRDSQSYSEDPKTTEQHHSTTTQIDSKTDENMIKIRSYNPVADVPMKPASATSVPVDKAIHDYDSYADYSQDREEEWSPNLIIDAVRTPDPIKLANTDYSSTSTYDGQQYDCVEIKKRTPQAPLSPLGFDKAKPTGRGRRRLTSSGSTSFDSREDSNDNDKREDDSNNNNNVPFYSNDTNDERVESTERHYNNALRHLQTKKAEAGKKTFSYLDNRFFRSFAIMMNSSDEIMS